MKKPFNLLRTGNLMISSAVFSLLLVSCSKKDNSATNDQNQVLADATTSTSGSTTSVLTRLAFPNATGFAKGTRGAYAKYEASGNAADLPKILYVDNLNDNGTGSLRAALAVTTPRIIIFRVGGTISLSSTLVVKSPYVTIAGYTAPGGGICIKGATLSIQASNVIVRNIRSRNGVYAPPHTTQATDGIGISAEGTKISNVIIDHCSVSWASDEQIGLNGTKGGLENVTIQNSILAEGFQGHAFAILCNGALGDAYHVKNISVHRNVMVNCEGRNPRFGDYTTGSVINNLVHNWGSKASEYTDYTMGDVLYNKFKPGKNTTSGGLKKSIVFMWDGSTVKSNMYTSGNLNVGQSTALVEYPSGSGGLKALSAASFYNSSVYGFTPTTDFTVLEKDLLPTAGAMPRDAVDARLISQYINGTGVLISSAGTYPTLAKGTYPANNNGVSLAWLVSKGYATSTTAAASLTASYLLNPSNGKTGYSIIEEYINDASIVK